MLKVFFPLPPDWETLKKLREAVADVEILTDGDDPAGSTVLIDGRPSAEMLDSFLGLQTVIVPFAGVPEPTLQLVKERPRLRLHNLHHNASATAETAVALLLAAAKLVPSMDAKMRELDWSPRYEPSRAVLLEGRTALILGYGEIGRRIATLCSALGMSVLATRGSVDRMELDGTVEVHPASALNGLLGRADAVIIALPQTPATVGLIGSEELALLPEGAILVNVARAQIVDEEALFNSLRTGHLHSAGLDVWYSYPRGGALQNQINVPGYFEMPTDAKGAPPSRFPFHELPNVVMSPHRGGTTMDTETKRVEHLARLLRAIADGKEVPNRVNMERGY